MFDKLLSTLLSKEAVAALLGIAFGVALTGLIMKIGASSVSSTEINRVLDSQSCQYTVKQLFYWKQPTTVEVTEITSQSFRHVHLAEAEYNNVISQLADDDLGVYDSVKTMILIDCYFGSDTASINTINFTTCDSCSTH